MKYNWQLDNFPNFELDETKIYPFIEKFALEFGEINGLLLSISEEMKQEVYSEIMVSEALKTSAIEGEYFSRVDVMSSLKMNLGILKFHTKSKNIKADAIAQLMIEVQKCYQMPLTESMLKQWHHILMKTDVKINAGKWRTGAEPMQVISGNLGNIIVHYEAPPSEKIPQMMLRFMQWYHQFSINNLGKIGEAMIFSSIAHLYFETIHPFEDGNGRIGRALAEKALAEKLEKPVFLSLSKSIEKNKKAYYLALKNAQRSLFITDWVIYFCTILNQALSDTKQVLMFTLKKVEFFDRYRNQLNERELKTILKMMEYGENGFEGGMSARKYISINKTSKSTATRDLQHLLEINAFKKIGAGRSVAYQINLINQI
jgi:Fic family protein